MSPNVPKFKKKISAFLTKEEGKISKESLIKTGIVIGAAGFASLKNVAAHSDALGTCSLPYTRDGGNQHANEISLSSTGTGISSGHTHCVGHSSHSSHCSGCTWCSCW